MAYVTPAYMVTLFTPEEAVAATNWGDRSAQEINDDRLQAACNSASGVIDGYLMMRYTLPLEMTDELAEILQIHAAAIARHILSPTLDFVEKAAERTYKWLEMIAEGTAILPGRRITPAEATPGIQEGEIAPKLVDWGVWDEGLTSDDLSALGF